MANCKLDFKQKKVQFVAMLSIMSKMKFCPKLKRCTPKVSCTPKVINSQIYTERGYIVSLNDLWIHFEVLVFLQKTKFEAKVFSSKKL
jgi:hypothetical protein